MNIRAKEEAAIAARLKVSEDAALLDLQNLIRIEQENQWQTLVQVKADADDIKGFVLNEPVVALVPKPKLHIIDHNPTNDLTFNLESIDAQNAKIKNSLAIMDANIQKELTINLDLKNHVFS